MKKANPRMSDEEICRLIGYPLEAYMEIQLDEAKNAEDIVNAELIESEADNSFQSTRGSETLDPTDSSSDDSSFGKHFAVEDDDDAFDDDEDSLFDV